MKATAKVVYEGNLRTQCTHMQSGSVIQTDAPIDNNGKGEAFSPTDLLATSLITCMQTIVGIFCQNHSIPFSHCEGTVEKVMYSDPRRVGELHVNLDFSENKWDEKTQKKVQKAAEACPVAKSIHPDIKLTFTYLF